MTNKFDDVMGIDRTMPGESRVDFNNRHAPLLNNDLNNVGSVDRDIYSPETVGRRVPVENNEAPVSYAPSSAAAPTLAAAPVMPVTPSASAPAAFAAAPVETLPPAIAAANTGYPALASVPPMPSATPKEQSAAELKKMTAEQNISEASRQELMNDPNATLMTSPTTGRMVDNAATITTPAYAPAPVSMATPVPVSPPAPAPYAPAKTASAAQPDKNFTNWLHSTFTRQDAAPAQPASIAAPAPHDTMASSVATPPAPLPQPEPLPESQPVAMEPVHLHPPREEAESMPQPEPLPVSAPVMHSPVVTDALPAAPVSVPVAPAITPDQSAEQMEPVHLHPPGSSAPVPMDNASSDMTGSNSDQSVRLTPPVATSQTRYLPDSRYAARRIQTDNSDYSN